VVVGGLRRTGNHECAEQRSQNENASHGYPFLACHLQRVVGRFHA
jgi:hypothetical protein